MIEAINGKLQSEFIQVNKVSGYVSYDDYYQNNLLTLMRSRDWETLNKVSVINIPENLPIMFSANEWRIGEAIGKKCNLYFTHNDQFFEKNITNEMKCIVLMFILTGSDLKNENTIRGYLEDLKKVALAMRLKGMSSFSELNDATLKSLALDNPLIFSDETLISTLSVLLKLHKKVPFTVNYSKPTAKKLGVTYRVKKQNLVIPPRIYKFLISSFSSYISMLMPLNNDLKSEVERLIDIQMDFKNKMIEKFRKGEMSLETLIKPKHREALVAKFQKEEIELIDHLSTEHDLWLRAFNEQAPKLRINIEKYTHIKAWKYAPFKVGEYVFPTIGKFKDFLVDLDMKCKALCLLLSGMRVDELNSMHPSYGAQKYLYKNQWVHLFTTRQSKITRGEQTEEDTFVTTKAGHDAFEILTTIHGYSLKFSKYKKSYFCSIKDSHYSRRLEKDSWSNTLSNQLNRWLKTCPLGRLTAEDESFLRVSTPSNQSLKAGDFFKFNPHQTRRSFAFYVIALDLMAFPQLKQQLSHLSMAMTRHYANNATYWGKLRQEVRAEEVRQKSEILSEVYRRLANKDRIAGGKAKALKTIAGDSTYFAEQIDNRKLEASYWAALLTKGKSHIHAIAPGMYCTNNNCDMRINIVLEECVDCEHDIILEGMYAEGKRINATKNLAILEQNNELTSSLASQLVMQIRSCEAILTDLEIDFEEAEIPHHVNSLLINTQTI